MTTAPVAARRTSGGHRGHSRRSRLLLAGAMSLGLLAGSAATASAATGEAAAASSLPVAPGPGNLIERLMEPIGEGASAEVGSGQGLALPGRFRVPASGRILCRLDAELLLPELSPGASGTISMNVDQRTCIQVAVERVADKITVDYLTLLGSRRITRPAGEGRLKIDALNYAQNTEPRTDALVTVAVDASLAGLQAKVLPGTSLLSTSSGVREVELAGSAPTDVFGVRGGVQVDVTRAMGWRGETGDVSLVLRRPGDQAEEFRRTTHLGSSGSESFHVNLDDVPNGTYYLEVGAAAFNGPSKIQVLHKRPPAPRLLFILLGCLLVLVGTCKTLIALGWRGRLAIGVLVLMTVISGAHYGLRMLHGDVTVQAAPTTASAMDESAVSAQSFPVGTIENFLEGRREAWLREAPGRAFRYNVPGTSDDDLRREPPSFIPLCLRSECKN